jgi:hypothetical protein
MIPTRRVRRRSALRRRWNIEPLEPRIALSSTITVDTLLDTGNPAGTTSLRRAIVEADAEPGSTINFEASLFASGPGTIALQSALPDLGADMTVTGPGQATLTIQGGGATSDFHAFTVDTGATASLSGLTISGAHEVSASTGGAIDNEGNLTLTDCTLSNSTNEFGLGGGLYNNGGQVTLTRCTLTGDTASINGGAIDNEGGSLTLNDCSVTANTSGFYGGAIFTKNAAVTLTGSTLTGNTGGYGGALFSYLGSMALTECTVTGNTAKKGRGGGLANDSTFTLTDSTISGNSAVGNGGGIANGYVPMTILRSTISGNSSGAKGGGIYHRYDALTITDSTIAGNSAQDGALVNLGSATLVGTTVALNRSTTDTGGIVNSNRLTLDDTLVAGNTLVAITGTPPGDVHGAVEPSSSFNLIANGEGLTGISSGAQGNQVGTAAAPIDAKLGVVTNNGGPTATVALFTGSPALDSGSASIAGVTIPTIDQRGALRGPAGSNTGTGVDIGAYEASSSYLVTSTADDGTVGTLRVGILWANFSTNANAANTPVSPNTITFDTKGTFATSQTIALTSTLVMSNGNTGEVVTGPGASSLTLQGGGPTSDFSALDVQSATTATISGLTIEGAATQSGDGGGIKNAGTLTLLNCAITGNKAVAGLGGGIANEAGTLTLTGCTVSTNSAGRHGGGIFDNGPLTIDGGTTISGNTAAQYGGGIENANGPLTLTGSTLSGNTAGAGGGLFTYLGGSATVVESQVRYNQAQSGSGGGIESKTTLTVTDSTLTGNSAANRGGGIANDGGTFTVNRSTFFRNTALEFGGAIDNQNGPATITNSTFDENTGQFAALSNSDTLTLIDVTDTANRSTGGVPGGIDNTGTLKLYESLVAGNFNGSSGTTPGDIQGAVDASSAFNLVGDGDDLSGIANGTQGNHIGTAASPIDPKLGPLTDNGGPTRTMAPLAGSPAIGAGTSSIAGVTVPVIDQRGAQRGASRDIGAFEASSMYVVSSTGDDLNAVGTLRAGVAWANVNAYGTTATNTIFFAFSTTQTIELGSRLELSNTTTPIDISGPEPIVPLGNGGSAGSTLLTLKGGGAGSAFPILVVDPAVKATVSSITFTGASSNVGAGIVNKGTLDVFTSTITGNQAGDGGGVYNNGTMSLTDSTISNNSSKYAGGGLVNYPSGSRMTLTRCTVSGNTSGAAGGLSNSATAIIIDSTFDGNHAGDEGGAIDNTGSLTVVGSTLSGNVTTGRGGGVWNSGTLNVANSTLASNSGAYGGGLQVNSGSARLVNVTLTGNRSSNDDGGGIDVANANSPTVKLFNTLVAGNFIGSSGAAPADVSGALNASSAGNLIGDGDNLTGITDRSQGNQLGTAASPIDAKLAPLANNRGTTLPVALQKGSPAIDAGINAVAVDPLTHAALATDQRGLERVVNGTVDIGAFEVQPAVTTLQVANAMGVFGAATTLVATLTSSGSPVVGASVSFTLTVGGHTKYVGSAKTGTNGVATLTGVGLVGINAGTATGALEADYAGDGTHDPTNGSADLTITPATATLHLGTLTFTYNGLPQSPKITTSPAGLEGILATYNAVAIRAGTYTVRVTLSNPNYTASPITATFVINKATPVLNWATPASMVYGTALGASQLDAGTSVPGTFTYAPSAGTVLHAGQGQRLSATFTPTDTIDYTSATASVRVNVTPAPLAISANDQTMVAGTAVPRLTASYRGFVNGDSASRLSSPVRLATSATSSSPPGSYAIVASGANSPDYAITFRNATLTVRPAPAPPSPSPLPSRAVTATITDAASAIVTILYDDILGHDPSATDIDDWRGQLSSGLSPRSLARILFDSGEHQQLVAEGQAPHIPLRRALADALRLARLVRLEHRLHPGGPMSLRHG